MGILPSLSEHTMMGARLPGSVLGATLPLCQILLVCDVFFLRLVFCTLLGGS